MKLYFFKINLKGMSRQELNKKLEKSLLIFVMIIFISLILIQAAMVNPGMSDYLNANKTYDGKALEAEEMLFEEGSVTMELIGQENNESLIVLLNGDEIAVFSSNVVSVSVKDGDILELDGTAAGSESEIEVVKLSQNIQPTLSGSRLRIGCEIKKVLKVKIK